MEPHIIWLGSRSEIRDYPTEVKTGAETKDVVDRAYSQDSLDVARTTYYLHWSETGMALPGMRLRTWTAQLKPEPRTAWMWLRPQTAQTRPRSGTAQIEPAS